MHFFAFTSVLLGGDGNCRLSSIFKEKGIHVKNDTYHYDNILEF